MARRKGSILGGIIFGAIFIVAGWMTYQHITKPIGEDAAASELWPKVVGTITYNNISTSKSNKKTMYTAEVEYSYSVDEESYTGSKISMMEGSSNSQSTAKKKLKKYPRDSRVDVYYDPEFPSTSVLEPGSSIWIWLITYLPLFFCLVGALILLQSILRIFRNLLF